MMSRNGRCCNHLYWNWVWLSEQLIIDIHVQMYEQSTMNNDEIWLWTSVNSEWTHRTCWMNDCVTCLDWRHVLRMFRLTQEQQMIGENILTGFTKYIFAFWARKVCFGLYWIAYFCHVVTLASTYVTRVVVLQAAAGWLQQQQLAAEWYNSVVKDKSFQNS